MGSRFGYDFSQVRIYNDTAAHQSAAAIGARAFTMGEHIGFAAGEFNPSARDGMSLLAHELTHVVQQAGDSQGALQCAPVLAGRKPGQQIMDEKFADDVDKALADSATVTRYIAKGDLRKASHHFHIEFKETFEKRHAEHAKAIGAAPPKSDKNVIVKGFTELKSGEIHLRERSADVAAAVHEAIHLNSKQSSDPNVSAFQKEFSHHLEEGVTEHFSNRVLTEQTVGPGSAYPDEVAMADTLISLVGEDLVGKAYFKGEHGARDALISAFNRTRGAYMTWQQAIASNDPSDWKRANQQLRTAFGRS